MRNCRHGGGQCDHSRLCRGCHAHAIAFLGGGQPRARTMRKAARRRLRGACAALVLLDMALIVLLAWAVLDDRAAESRRRDALAQRIGADAAASEAEREEIYAQAVGEALDMVGMRSEVRASDGWAQVGLSNNAASAYAVQMTLVLAENGDSLGQTGRIDPGYYLEWFQLERELAPGSYHCLARCAFYAADSGAYLGSAVRQVLLAVEWTNGRG